MLGLWPQSYFNHIGDMQYDEEPGPCPDDRKHEQVGKAIDVCRHRDGSVAGVCGLRGAGRLRVDSVK